MRLRRLEAEGRPVYSNKLGGAGEHLVAAAHFGGGRVVADSLERTGHGGVGDVGGTEIVHEGGVGPEVIDGRARGKLALVGAGHGIGHGRGGVAEPALGNAEGGIRAVVPLLASLI
jgi:hypothetical protein